jgi:hypothetical protein
MPTALSATRAKELTRLVQDLGGSASFRNILREAARAGILRKHETLRRYLDLLVAGRVLKMYTRDVGSVYPQQLYRVLSKKPKVLVGLAVLRVYGLSWSVPDSVNRVVSTDFEGLVRSKTFDAALVASLEDCLIHELSLALREKEIGISLPVAMISTTGLDLPYLLRRADEMRVGRTVRLLLNRLLEIVSKAETEIDAYIFMAVRAQFLRMVRKYTRSGHWRLVDESGVGAAGIDIIKNLTEHDLVLAAGKQLGVTG